MSANRPRTRLYLDQDLKSGAHLIFGRDQAAYLTKVLRLKSGAEIGLFNGRDGEWRAVLHVAGQREVRAGIGTQLMPPEAQVGPTLAFAPLKKAPLEWMLVKATELGVGTLQPILTDYTNAQMPRMDRLQSLLIEAAEQCERCRLPTLAQPQTLAAWLDTQPDGLVWVGAEAGPTHDVRKIDIPPQGVLVGPEGGFSPAELRVLQGHPALRPVGLGGRILRAETAGLSLLTLAQMARGEFLNRPLFRP